MIIISAMSYNHIIGSGDGMPWEVPAEYRQFLDFIDGQTVIMGRRSWEIFGKDLDRSDNIVVSRSAQTLAGAQVCTDIPAALAAAQQLGKTVFSAGGGAIYRQTMPYADQMYISFIKGTFRGDTYFPAIHPAEWRIVRREDHAEFEFVVYHRKS